MSKRFRNWHFFKVFATQGAKKVNIFSNRIALRQGKQQTFILGCGERRDYVCGGPVGTHAHTFPSRVKTDQWQTWKKDKVCPPGPWNAVFSTSDCPVIFRSLEGMFRRGSLHICMWSWIFISHCFKTQFHLSLTHSILQDHFWPLN